MTEETQNADAAVVVLMAASPQRPPRPANEFRPLRRLPRPLCCCRPPVLAPPTTSLTSPVVVLTHLLCWPPAPPTHPQAATPAPA